MRKGVVDPADAAACLEMARRLLDFRWRAEKELRRRLALAGYDEGAIAATFDALRKEGWLNDARFAASYARARLRRGFGRKRLAMELRQRGVDATVAASALDVAVEEEPEEMHLLETCRKRARLLVRSHGDDFLSTAEGRNKLIAYLLKQGYEYGDVVAAIRQIQN